MAIEIKIKTKDVKSGEVFDETLDVPENKDPKEYAEQIIKRFNVVEKERYGDKGHLRKLVSVGEKTGVIFCEWKKMNLTTVIKNDEVYDVIRCPTCKNIRKRYGLDGSPVLIECHPERTCNECNRVFKTQKGYDDHNEKNIHNTPQWLPDGV